MASINDFGADPADTLSDPPLGGPDGWAAAVAAALNGSDVTVDARIASQAAADDAKYVNAAGDTITGNLTVARVGVGAQMLVSSDVEYAEFLVDAPSGKTAGFLLRQAAKTLWKIAKSSSAAGDLNISRYDDAGVQVNPLPFSISRATGKTTIADLNYQEEGLMVAAPGWADFGSNYGGLICTKHAGMVTLEGLFKRTAADLSLGSSTVLVGTVPVGFRSVHDFTVPVMAWISTGYQPVRGVIYANGELRIQALPAVTIANGGWVSFVATYRQGS